MILQNLYHYLFFTQNNLKSTSANFQSEFLNFFFAGYFLNLGTQFPEFFVQIFIAALNIINVIYNRSPLLPVRQ